MPPGRPPVRLPATPTQYAQDWQEQHRKKGGTIRRVTLYAEATRALRQLARPRKASALIDRLIIEEWLRMNPGKGIADLQPPLRRRTG